MRDLVYLESAGVELAVRFPVAAGATSLDAQVRCSNQQTSPHPAGANTQPFFTAAGEDLFQRELDDAGRLQEAMLKSR